MTQDLLIYPSFKAFPKLARLRRDCVITEKIDGTNAAIGVTHPDPDGAVLYGMGRRVEPIAAREGMAVLLEDGTQVFAQSRKRIIDPQSDNFGFAKFVHENADVLAQLGPGYHYGEWWGNGIQRGYGLEQGHKVFSLFNPDVELASAELEALVTHVPVLFRGQFHTFSVDIALERLRQSGSQAAPGFQNPEGIVVYHTAGRTSFKVTLDNDGVPKSQVQG